MDTAVELQAMALQTRRLPPPGAAAGGSNGRPCRCTEKCCHIHRRLSGFAAAPKAHGAARPTTRRACRPLSWTLPCLKRPF